MARIKDIAQRTGISSAAVSIYLRDPNTTRVGSETKRKIDAALDELSYVPNSMARALSSSRSRIVGALIPYNGPLFRSTFVNEILSGLQTSLFHHGYSLIFPPAEGQRSPTVLRNQLRESGGFDGYVLFGTRYCSHDDMVENVRLLEQAGLPSVMVNMPEMAGPANQVILRETAETSPIRYLLSQGHRRLIVMVGRDNTPDTIECITHARQVCAEYGVVLPEQNILYGDYENTVSRSAMLTRLSVDRDFTAVYSLSDTMAMGVYDALSELKLRVPADVSVVGRNDSSFARLLSPPLTTVHRPLFAAGEKSAEVLLQSLDSGRTGIKLYLDGSLIVRGSTRVHHEGE